VVTMTMYAGRVGPLTLLYAFSRRRAMGKFEYVEERVMIG
jgi:trk system potassium uptake protein TrkH